MAASVAHESALCAAAGPLLWLARRASDEKSIVRKAALQVVHVVLNILLAGSPAPEAHAACERASVALLLIEAERCSDPVMTLRRQALVDWTELILAHPTQAPLWRWVLRWGLPCLGSR